MSVTVQIMQWPHAAGLPLPSYATASAAGMDLSAAVDEAAPLVVQPGERIKVPTGLSIAMPIGFEGQVRPRSGLALNHGLTVLNAPGTVDADYRGEIAVILINTGREPVTITRGMRIAQLIIAPVIQATLQPVAALDETVRGQGGFGSTGR